jgi:hypothetical protein
MKAIAMVSAPSASLASLRTDLPQAGHDFRGNKVFTTPNVSEVCT